MKQFSIILYFSFTFLSFHFAEGDDALAIPVDNNFTEKNIKTGNAFVKFFKYGKHSILWRGINGGAAGFLINYLGKLKNPTKYKFCINTKADIILNLFSFCYDCKYMIKDRLGLFLNCSCLGGFSAYNLLNDRGSVPFLNINFGVSYVLLRKKNFLWNIYAGIGVTWGFEPFSWKSSYNVANWAEENFKKNFEKDIEDKGGLFKSGEWKNYFSCKQFKKNIKHFDVIFDCSAFDFTIKDHFRITLEWECGIGNFYKIMLHNIYFTTFDNFANICLHNLSINIGYVF